MKKLALLPVLGVLYVTTAELNAKRKAEAFCDSVAVGESTANLRERAVSTGARERATDWAADSGSARVLNAACTGFYPGADFICRIAEKNVVIDKKNPHIVTSFLG